MELGNDRLYFSPFLFLCCLWLLLQNWVLLGICLFQNINFTHSLLSLLTMRKLCNEGVIKLGSVWKCQTSKHKKEQSSQRHLSFCRVWALHGPDTHVHVLIVSFMMSGFESVMCSEKKCDGTLLTIAHHLAGATLVPPDPHCYQVMFYVFLHQALEGQTICLGSWRWTCAWWRIMRLQHDLWLGSWLKHPTLASVLNDGTYNKNVRDSKKNLIKSLQNHKDS